MARPCASSWLDGSTGRLVGFVHGAERASQAFAGAENVLFEAKHSPRNDQSAARRCGRCRDYERLEVDRAQIKSIWCATAAKAGAYAT